MNYQIVCSDNLEYLKTLPDNSVDSVVTDSPYGLSKEPDVVEMLSAWITTGYKEVNTKGFMGRGWDSFVPQPILWKEVYRVLKPGGHLISFFGTRTYDYGVMAIRLGGFEIRDTLMWMYSTGFPKSFDVSKGIDKKFGVDITAPNSPEAKFWDGYGTNLKPAMEPIVLARKPISEPTIVENVLKWGVGAINIDGCRIPTTEKIENHSRGKESAISKGIYGDSSEQETYQTEGQKKGRFPSNMILEDSEEVQQLFDVYGTTSSGKVTSDKSGYSSDDNAKFIEGNTNSFNQHGDSGSVARFFYSAKCSKRDRNEGLEEFETKKTSSMPGRRNMDSENEFKLDNDVTERFVTLQKNNHPTVKPTSLMMYLTRLVTPKGGTVLDPFNGSGSTGKACVLEDFNYIGIEMDKQYCDISEARIKYAIDNKETLKKFYSKKVDEVTKNNTNTLQKEEPKEKQIF